MTNNSTILNQAKFRNKYINTSLLFLFFVLPSFVSAQNLNVNWQKFLANLDPVWDTTHTYFYEGAFIGNGLTGAMVYREDENALRWDINRTDLTAATSQNKEFTRVRLGVGKFILRPKGKIKSSNMRIDLYNGKIVGSIITDKGSIKFTTYVHYHQNVIVTDLEEKNESAEWSFIPERAKEFIEYQFEEKFSKFGYLGPEPKKIKTSLVEINQQNLYEGAQINVAWSEGKSSNKRQIIAAIGHNTLFATDTISASTLISKARKEKNLLTSHQQWWNNFYPKTFLSIPDKRLESFYWIQLYKLASALRANGPMLDLMGPWFAHTPWPATWWNLNVQLTYSPLFSLNRLDLAETLFRTLDKYQENLIKNAPAPFQHNSAGIGRVTTYDLVGEVNLLNSKFPFYDMEPGNLTWVMYYYYQHYRHLMDEDMLRERIFPLLKRSVNLYLNILVKEDDGKYHLPKTFSPEYAVTKDCNYDLSLLKWGCSTLKNINESLKLKDPDESKWNDVLSNLTPFPTDSNGFKIGADVSLTESHRHFSHMMMVYPLKVIPMDDPNFKETIQKTFDHWINLNGAHAGYTYTYACAMAAGQNNGDIALKYFYEFLKPLPINTLYREAGPVIETPLAAITSLHEMFLQHSNDVIHIFPAVPTTWKDLSFYKLRTEGSFLISASKKDGNTEFIAIESLHGYPCKIKTDLDPKNIQLVGDRKFNMEVKENGVLVLDLKKGEKVFIKRKDAKTSFDITPVKGAEADANYYGMKLWQLRVKNKKADAGN